jgi:hypothetical protein
VQGRAPVAAPKPPPVRPGEEAPLTDEMREALRAYLPPAGMAPRVIVKWSPENELLISGMLAGGRELAHRPAIVDVPVGQGHVVMFANNPMWRHETQGSWNLIFNTVMNFNHLHAGRGAKVPVNDSAAPSVVANER